MGDARALRLLEQRIEETKLGECVRFECVLVQLFERDRHARYGERSEKEFSECYIPAQAHIV
jgi:hypothetical protein